LRRAIADHQELLAMAVALRGRYGESEEVARLEQLAWRRLEEAEPVRLSDAQQLLGVSNQTVRNWAKDGVLDDCCGSPQRVGLGSVIRARELVEQLRAQGREREFMATVLSRLEASALERDTDFRKSVGQMRRGERVPRPY
jgi:hypothetical protein